MTMGTNYEPVHSDAGDDAHDEKGLQYHALVRAQRRANITFYSSLIIFSLSLLTFAATWLRTPTELECAKRVSPYSPMWEAVEFWEGDLTNNFNHSTIYRGPPTPEREKAWDDLWHWPSIPVDDAGVAALNKTEQGRYIEIVGSDPKHPTYGAIVEVFHQLHCLNLVRQYTWRDHYDPNDEWFPSNLRFSVGGRMHVDHCIEALRLSLMCYGDITPVLIKYDDHRSVGRTADFSVHHQCRNFDKIVDWVKENGVGIPFNEEPENHEKEQPSWPAPSTSSPAV